MTTGPRYGVTSYEMKPMPFAVGCFLVASVLGQFLYKAGAIRATGTLQSHLMNTRDGSGQAQGHARENRTVLGIQGARFTLNEQPTFLLGISYYAALGAPEDLVRKDLDDLQHHGFNWIRVWATWAMFGQDVSAVDAKGQPREPFLGKLQSLIAECDRRRLVVDVTLTRGKGDGALPSFEAHRRAVQTLVSSLKAHRNWYFDLANECDVRDARYVSIEELKALRDAVRRLDPQRLVTASCVKRKLEKTDLQEALFTANLDFITPHRARNAASPGETEAWTRACLAMMKEIGRSAPVHFQEPFRRGFGRWEPSAADFLADLRGARAGGGAGWCFHNGSQRNHPESPLRRSFDLRDRRLFEQLDTDEQTVVAQAALLVRQTPEPDSP